MRLLADECCDRLVVEALRVAGHDVRYVLETDRAASDERVVDIALADDRILLTEDKDFGDLAVRYGRRVPGVVLIRLSAADPNKAGRVILVLENAADRLRDCYTVIQRNRVRFRVLS